MINDFEKQKIFWDRREVYRILKENDIPIPKLIIADRGEKIDNNCNKKKKNDKKQIENLINTYKNYNPGIEKVYIHIQKGQKYQMK